MKAIKATVYQELDEINFFHTNAAMVDVRVRGDDGGYDISFSIGKAVFYLEGIGTKLEKCQAIRDIAQAIITAADLFEAEINEAEAYFTEQLLLGE